MKLLLITLSLMLSITSFAEEIQSQGAIDLGIIEGDYVIKKGPKTFCYDGPVGWFNPAKADKENPMLMLGTKLIFSNVNRPEQKEIIEDCEVTSKTETKRISNIGFLTESESRHCKSLKESTRRTVRVEKDQIVLEVTSSSSETGNFSKACYYELRRPSREQQSVKK